MFILGTIHNFFGPPSPKILDNNIFVHQHLQNKLEYLHIQHEKQRNCCALDTHPGMFVKCCVVPIAVLTGFLCLRPSRTDIRGASNIEKLTAGIMNQIHEPGHLILHASR